MERYIEETLALGIIQLSLSPLGAGFKSVRLCVHCQCLNDIKNNYPLPLISTAWKPVQGARVFT